MNIKCECAVFISYIGYLFYISAECVPIIILYAANNTYKLFQLEHVLQIQWSMPVLVLLMSIDVIRLLYATTLQIQVRVLLVFVHVTCWSNKTNKMKFMLWFGNGAVCRKRVGHGDWICMCLMCVYHNKWDKSHLKKIGSNAFCFFFL